MTPKEVSGLAEEEWSALVKYASDVEQELLAGKITLANVKTKMEARFATLDISTVPIPKQQTLINAFTEYFGKSKHDKDTQTAFLDILHDGLSLNNAIEVSATNEREPEHPWTPTFRPARYQDSWANGSKKK